MSKIISVILLVILLSQVKCCLIWLRIPILQPVYEGDDCVVDDEHGTCKLLTECGPVLAELQKSGTALSIPMLRKLQRITCGFQADQSMVCCVPKAEDDKTDEDPITTKNPNGTKNVDNNNEGLNEQKHPNLRLLPADDCGAFEDNKIFGGNRTALFEMPWMVLLSYDSVHGTKLSCGGTLINERYVLTAAHCVSFLGDRLKLKGVLLGEHDVRNDPDCERTEGVLSCAPNVKKVTIEKAIAHTGYTPQKLVDDIALIRLAEPANLSLDSIKPVCLPITKELQTESLAGLNGIVAGWGATESGLQSPVLMTVDLPIIDNKKCQAAYGRVPRIHESQLCAGGVRDKDSCSGDSGGPLLYPGRMTSSGIQYVQRGIVSFGSKRCGLGGFPGVYTKVAYYMKWILDNISK